MHLHRMATELYSLGLRCYLTDSSYEADRWGCCFTALIGCPARLRLAVGGVLPVLTDSPQTSLGVAISALDCIGDPFELQFFDGLDERVCFQVPCARRVAGCDGQGLF